jgi:hypothetical protein
MTDDGIHPKMKDPTTSSDIEIKDVSAQAFKLILKYIYSEAIDLSSPEEALDLSTVISTMFKMPEVTEECKNFLEKSVNIDNVVNILYLAELRNSPEVKA